jgi:hypothetical protein
MIWPLAAMAADKEFSGGTFNIDSNEKYSPPEWDKVVIFNNAKVNLADSGAITISGTKSSDLALYVQGATLSLGKSTGITSSGEVQFEGGPGGIPTILNMASGSYITIEEGADTGEQGSFVLGANFQGQGSGSSQDQTGNYTNKGQVIVNVIGYDAVINANQAFLIAEGAVLNVSPEMVTSDPPVVDPSASQGTKPYPTIVPALIISANTSFGTSSNIGGMFIVGLFENYGGWDHAGIGDTNDLWKGYDGKTFTQVNFKEPMRGGTVKIAAGANLLIVSPIVMFGETSVLEMAPGSVLEVEGNLYLNRNESMSNG